MSTFDAGTHEVLRGVAENSGAGKGRDPFVAASTYRRRFLHGKVRRIYDSRENRRPDVEGLE